MGGNEPARSSPVPLPRSLLPLILNPSDSIPPDSVFLQIMILFFSKETIFQCHRLSEVWFADRELWYFGVHYASWNKQQLALKRKMVGCISTRKLNGMRAQAQASGAYAIKLLACPLAWYWPWATETLPGNSQTWFRAQRGSRSFSISNMGAAVLLYRDREFTGTDGSLLVLGRYSSSRSLPLTTIAVAMLSH